MFCSKIITFEKLEKKTKGKLRICFKSICFKNKKNHATKMFKKIYSLKAGTVRQKNYINLVQCK